ncbi:MAG: NAD(P)-dependent alcohol dehydrogenase [Ignavibacteriae bacterium HGW-Ignavibacteriae-3]|nr:MAG: NAD(P)-dependent alcohol dehydrogenase [Ignavibacteriae bacterium HGW-Ignavibacteriae-3]
MKAVICTKYGSPEVLQIKEVKKPVPKPNEVLIKILATTAHIGDTKIRRFEPGLGPVKDFFFKPLMRVIIGFTGPRKKILGMELSGVIEAIGRNVKFFKAGDAVFGSTEFRFGTYAQYCCISENGIIAIKPANMTHEEAAPVSNAGITALVHLRKANIQKGQKVLIYGASGSVGTYAIQIAKNLGAEVTAVCSSANIELVKSVGADKAIDYMKEDFTQNGEIYDVIYDAVGKIEASKRRKSLSNSGYYLNVLTASGNIKLNIEDLYSLKELCEEGKLKTVIDRCYPLEEIVEAHRYVDKGHKKGNVIITIEHNGKT